MSKLIEANNKPTSKCYPNFTSTAKNKKLTESNNKPTSKWYPTISVLFSDKYFKVLFSYKAAYRGELSLREGEIIVGKERDRNGWMLGRKAHSKEEGWFPAVYVDQVT